MLPHSTILFPFSHLLHRFYFYLTVLKNLRKAPNIQHQSKFLCFQTWPRRDFRFRILVVYYTLISFVRAIYALYLTTSILCFHVSPTSSRMFLLRRTVIILIITQRFIPLFYVRRLMFSNLQKPQIH